MFRTLTIPTFFILCCLGLCLVIANCKTTGFLSIKKPNENIIKQVEALTHFSEEFIVFPGQATLLKFPYFGPFEHEALVCNEKEKIPFFTSSKDHVAMAYLAPSYFEEAHNFSCQFQFRENDDEQEDSIKLTIGKIILRPYSYPKEHLKVAQKKVDLSAKDRERVLREGKMLEAIYRQKTDLLFNEPFIAPLSSKITSIFGTRRIFNNKMATEHLGTDFRAKVGTLIKSSNSGQVVFAGDLFFGGHTVVIDHGLAIFTSYSHLSKIAVEVGEKVTKDTVLGYSGMTGRVNGPHLHWGIKINDHWIDGHSLIDASNKNFPEEKSNIAAAR